ncbi:hypothetical protein [Vibrio aestuarianus]|uniref:Uncharacterized protein n=1 Tax=Vibrio aestuarianus TaxID=28171 RepID=A0A9X4EZT4_9VIBR|nr:hypothetical protein [Vibrio aestuarianus]MDE1243288.1 hypothetical protein [Vibrio aestuarianus]
MEELSKKSRKNKKQAFLIEASIYFYGEHFNQNYDKAIEIIESSQFFSESEPEQLIILGQSYYFKYILSDMTSSSFYFKAKKYLRKSYELDSGYATRELAFLLIRSESLDDLEIAGDIFEIFANEGKEEDIRNYKAYLRAIEN